VPTDTTAMVTPRPRRSAPASEAPIYNQDGLVPGTGPKPVAMPVGAPADDDLPF
jgi:hypothetical protein